MRKDDEEEPEYAAALARFAERVDHLNDTDRLVLRGFWAGGDARARHHAWKAVDAALQASGRDREMKDLEDGLTQWAGAAFSRGWAGFGYSGPTERGQDERRDSLPVLLDAGAALLLRDVLPPGAFDVLIGPWRAFAGDEAVEA